MRPRFPSIQFLVFTSRSFKSVGGNLAVLTGADLATLAEEFDALASKTTSIHQPNVVRHPVEPKEEPKASETPATPRQLAETDARYPTSAQFDLRLPRGLAAVS